MRECLLAIITKSSVKYRIPKLLVKEMNLEIRDPIHGSIELTPNETAVIDSPYFQRLRNIKQLGFTEFSYPGATHNRYCHSLGAMHLAGKAFDHIFQGHHFKSRESKWRLRQTVRLAALLHDVGHGPLSHTSEEVMPLVSELKIDIYGALKNSRKATHEDYTIKIITDSSLTEILKEQFQDLKPQHIAHLIDKSLPPTDDFFIEGGVNTRPLLSQIVSSELDVDRMDYLARDSYYCGTSYGKVDSDWLIANLSAYNNGGKLNLALNRRALYTFDDFLISRYHMYLMVYFHHKAIIYDEMLFRYLKSPDCDFFLPSTLTDYINYDDYRLHTHLNRSQNKWARMIADKKPYRMLYESHDQKPEDISQFENTFKKEGISIIRASSKGSLSKYYSTAKTNVLREPIFVIDSDQGREKRVTKIEDTTQVFHRYEETRKIDRIYVDRSEFTKAQNILDTL
jgi:HD superfamily phosphohydrolase